METELKLNKEHSLLDHLTLEYEIRKPNGYPELIAQVILDGWSSSRVSNMPAITRECDTFNEFDAELRRVERMIEAMRGEAKHRFSELREMEHLLYLPTPVENER